jgi:hypothetical protein
VVARAIPGAEAFHGPLAAHGPDLVVGYGAGFRASAATGLGRWGAATLEPNAGRWGADHCIDPRLVPGVVFADRDLRPWPRPSFRDVPELALGRPLAGAPASPPPPADEDEQREIEEKLKGLGYV